MKTYMVPSSGYYYVAGHVLRYTPTGKFETIPNPNRKWYCFWEPKFVVREICKIEKFEEGLQIRLLKAGDKISYTKLKPWRIQNG